MRRRFLRPLKRVNLTVLYSFYFLETCKSHRVIYYSTLWPKQTCFLGSRCYQIPIGIKFFATKKFSKKMTNFLHCSNSSASPPPTREGPFGTFLLHLYTKLRSFTRILCDDPAASPPDAVSWAGLVHTHAKDTTGLGGPNSLKLLLLLL